MLGAHKVAWTYTNGDPGELCVLHRCDNRVCVNPAHLFLGTKQDNVDDMYKKGRDRCRGAEERLGEADRRTGYRHAAGFQTDLPAP